MLPNLPPQLTSFVDREKVVAEIKTLLQTHRLVTLIGTGGAGKTRCAIKVAGEMLDAYDDGVWLAELAAISDPSLVASVIARTLDVQEAPNRPMLDTLLAYLKRKRLLLILDNCEHVIEEARHVVAAILHSCPEVRILATSRESFTIAGEQAYRIPSLAVPSQSELLSADEMSQYGAVQLFTDRATSADNRFTLSVESAPHVAEICRRLDGIPLAIELAAARVRALSPKQLAQKLDERFRVLTAGNRSALPRHQTMRALIDWSYDLLSDDERRLFRKLSIFAGGSTLETASAVWSDEAIDEIATLDLLSSLVDKSLVQTEPVVSETRYRLLESTRQYGHEKLTEAGEYDVVAREHARAFLALAEQLKDAWETTADRAWLAQAEPELENFRAALSWALTARGDVLLGQRLTFALKPLWRFLFPMEGRRWVQVAQGFIDAETPPAVIAGLDLTEVQLATVCLQSKAALASGERARREYGALDDPLGNVEAKRLVGNGLIGLGKISEGEALLHESLMEARALGARKSVSSALTTLGMARAIANDVAAARQLFGEALRLREPPARNSLQRSLRFALPRQSFGPGVSMRRCVWRARRLLSSAHSMTFGRLRMCCETRRPIWCRYVVTTRRAYPRETRSLQRSICSLPSISRSRCSIWRRLVPHVRTPMRRSWKTAVARRILGYVDARIAVCEALREYTEQCGYDGTIRALREMLGADELLRRMAEGSTWSEDHAVAEAMLI